MKINSIKNDVIIASIYALFLVIICLLFSNSLITSSFSLHFVYIAFTIVAISILSIKKYILSFKSVIKTTIIYSIFSFIIIYLVSIFLENTMEPLGIGIMLNVLFFCNYLYFIIGVLFSYLISKILKCNYFQKKSNCR